MKTGQLDRLDAALYSSIASVYPGVAQLLDATHSCCGAEPATGPSGVLYEDKESGLA